MAAIKINMCLDISRDYIFITIALLILIDPLTHNQETVPGMLPEGLSLRLSVMISLLLGLSFIQWPCNFLLSILYGLSLGSFNT